VPFTPAERQIFGPFWDGRTVRHADPLRIRRRLAQLLGREAPKLLEQWQAEEAPPQVRIDAAEHFLWAVSEAFELPKFDPADGQGATEDVVIGVWNAFHDWLKKKGPTTPNGPTSSPPTDSPPAPPSATMPTRASSSTPTASAAGFRGRLRTPSPSAGGPPR
jgi:hypothetical protein